jgi:predicted MFS family arabinose efflux permease
MSALAPLRHRAFRYLIAGRTVSALGNSFAPIALAFAVLDLTGSASDLGLVVGVRTLVNVIFLLFGGVLADRMPKHLLMVGSSLAAALTQGTVAALVLTHTANIPILIVLSGLNGMVGALSLPASSSILPQTVPADVRQQANAISRLSLNSAAVIGAPVAGIVVAAVGPGWGIAVDAVTFALAAAAFAFLPVPEPAAATPKADRPHIFADLRTGWSEFRSRTWLWVVVAGFCVLNASWAGGLFVLGPVVADQTFGRRAWGFILAAQTAGMIVGGLIALRLRLHRLLYFGVFATLFEAATVFVLGLDPRVWLLAATALIAGIGLEQFGVAWETTMQEHIPADKLARVYSYDMVGSFVAIPIGEIAVGPISRAAGINPTLIGAGLLMTAAVIFMLSSRDVRTLPHKLPEEAAEPVTESVA